MGRYRRDKLRCHKCLKKDGLNHAIYEGTSSDPGITWRNVEVIGLVGEYPRVKCKNCGHEYTARSIAGYRAVERWLKDNASK